jgi:hypothetical protein
MRQPFLFLIRILTKPHLLILILNPLPPSPEREGGILMIYNSLAPLLKERGWGEVIHKKGRQFPGSLSKVLRSG